MKNLVLLIFVFSVSMAIGQLKVGNNAKVINPNSLFEMESNNKGMLLPRLALVATDSTKPLTAHIQGMIVYNLSNSGVGNKAVSPGYYYNDGTQWVRILGSVSSSNTTAGQLVTVTNGTGATLTNMQVGVDTTALKTFVNGRTTVSNSFNNTSRALTTSVNGITSNAVTIPTTNDSTTASNGLTMTGKDVRLGGTLTGATTIATSNTNTLALSGLQNGTSGDSLVSLGAGGVLRKVSVSAVVSGDNWGSQTVAVSAPLTGNGTSGSPLNVARANTTAANNLVTVTNGTNATFTAMTVGVDTTNLKSFLNNKITVSSNAPLSGNGTSGSPLNITRANTTAANNLVTVTNGTNATLTAMTVGVDTTNLKSFINGRTTVSNTFNNSIRALTTTVNGIASSAVTIPTTNDSTTASNGLTMTGKDVRLGGTLTGATTIATSNTNTLALSGLQNGTSGDSLVSLGAGGVLRKVSVSAVVSGDNWGSQTVAVSAPLTGNGTSGSPLNVARANTTAANNLVTVTNGTNATFTAMTVGVDTTNLKSFLNNKITVNSSAPLTGNGTTSSPLTITSNNTTAGQLVTVTNGTGASLTNMQVGVDTTALKTFVNGRTTVSNTFNTSTRALTTTVNGITSNAVTIPTTIDSTTASNGLNLNGKDLRLGGTLTMPTTITQGSNLMTFTGAPGVGNTGIINMTNTATGANGTVVLDMLTPNSDVSYYRIGKSTSTGNSSEITFRTVGNNSDSNSLSLGFFGSQYLVNLTKNGNLGVGTNLFVPTQKLDVDGGARIRSLASGAITDSIVTVDATGVLRRRSISAVVSGDNWGSQTVAVSAPLTGNGTSGSPLNITRANTTAANNLVTVTNGTNATFTAMTVGVDTTNLKSFLNNKITVNSSAPLTGNGTTSPLSITSNNTTAGQLVTVTNGTGATLTNMQVGVDTTALKTFVNGRTTVSNTFNPSTRALTTTVNGITSNAVTIPTTIDSTTASNGLNLNGKDIRLGGTLNTATTINQGANTLTFNATPTSDYTAGININNNATGNAGATVLNMISPNTDSSFFRIGKLISTGNVAEISYTHTGFNNDTNRLSFGFHSSRYLLNLMNNGNLSIGNIIATQKLDVDGGARIRSLASGAITDSIVTVDATGVLRRRSISAVVSGDNWGSQTVAVSAPLTGNGTSGSPLNITRANTTAANNLVTVTNGTNATFTAMTVGVDTTNLKSFVNARTTNTLTASANAITNTTNGISATLTPSAGTITTKFLGFDASGNLVTDSAVTTATEPWMVQGGTTQATSNTQNIYQTGTVAIGKNAVYNDANTQNVRLDVEGNMHVGGNDTSNYIAFKGITGDNPSAYDHAYLGVRKFGGTENSEMVIFKGDNHNGSATGTDRIRVLSGELQFQTYTNDVSGSFESVSRSILDTTRMIIRTDGNVGIGTLSPTSLLDVNGTVRIRTLNSGASSDSIVTSDANGVLRRRSATSVFSSGTTVSNAFNTSTRALTTTVNGITSNAVTIPTTNDSTTASNGLNINGKDIRLGGTLNSGTTISQGTNLMTFTGTPSSANSSVMTLSNTATGPNGTVLLDMLTPNSNVSYFRLGRETAFGNSAEITYRHIGNNNDSNSLSLGFFNSQHLVNLTKNGNLGIGSNLFVPTQKLDVDGGARIRNLASGANSDSIVTVDGTGVLRRRNLNAFVSNIYNTDGTLTGERTLTNNGNVLNFQGTGGSGFPLRLRSGTTTSSEVTLGIYDRSSSDSRGWMIGSNTYNGVANTNGSNSRELHFSNLGFTNPGVKMKIDTLGNVAIGRNTDAAVRLAIQGGIAVGNGNFAIDSAYVQDNNFVTFRHNGTSEDFIGYRNNTFYFADCPGGSDVTNPNVMVLGNLGVGNTTPAARLHVTGNARITSMSLGAATDSIVVVDANGELKKRASNSVASSNQISASVSASVPAMSIGDAGIVNLTVTGAAVGDVVIVNPTSDLPAGVVIAYSRVSAANTVRVGFTGTGSSGVFSQTFDIKVIK